MFWITRVPSSVKEAKDLLASECQFKPCTDERYSYSEYESNYAGIRQKQVLYHSDPMHEQKMKTLEKDLGKKLTAAKKSLRKLCKIESNCEPDAHKGPR